MLTTRTQPRTAAELVADARGRVENLDVEQFAAEVGRPDVVVVDLREPEEVAAGHVPGAVRVPRGMLEFRADPTSPYHDPRLQPGARILLYCASGGRSALAADALRTLGHTDVAHLAPGFAAWVAAGCEVAAVGAGEA